MAVSGNAVGLSRPEWEALPASAQQVLREKATAQLTAEGAHFVVDSVADLLPVLDDIQARLARGERP